MKRLTSPLVCARRDAVDALGHAVIGGVCGAGVSAALLHGEIPAHRVTARRPTTEPCHARTGSRGPSLATGRFCSTPPAMGPHAQFDDSRCAKPPGMRMRAHNS